MPCSPVSLIYGGMSLEVFLCLPSCVWQPGSSALLGMLSAPRRQISNGSRAACAAAAAGMALGMVMQLPEEADETSVSKGRRSSQSLM